MAALVTVEDLKDYLRILGADFDAELALKADLATEIVVDYIKQPDHTWTTEDVPDVIKAAICEVARNLVRGDESPLSEDIKNILRRRRDPAIA